MLHITIFNLFLFKQSISILDLLFYIYSLTYVQNYYIISFSSVIITFTYPYSVNLRAFDNKLNRTYLILKESLLII